MIVVINTRTLGVSEYGLDWTDLVVDDDGAVCGLAGEGAAEGLYALDDGVDDAGEGELVAPVVATGLMGFGSPEPKVATRAYVVAQGAGRLMVTVSASGAMAGGERAIPYVCPLRSSDALVERVVRLARGVRAQRLAVTLEPETGRGWRLGRLALRMEVRGRRLLG